MFVAEQTSPNGIPMIRQRFITQRKYQRLSNHKVNGGVPDFPFGFKAKCHKVVKEAGSLRFGYERQ